MAERREFLKRLFSGTLRGLTGLLIGWPALAYVTHSRARSVTVVFGREERGGRVSYKDGVYLLQEPGQEPLAVSARCTHLGCRVQHDPLAGRFVCPCHGSLFDTRGRRLKGPAANDLTVLPLVQNDHGDIAVTYQLP